MPKFNIAHITGLDVVVANIRKEKVSLSLRTGQGLKAAGLYLQGKSQRKVPVDLGNLKASAFTRATGLGWETSVTVGYTAAYALFVHELVKMKLKGIPRPRPKKGLYWDPQGRAQAKFLEEPARTEYAAMVAIVQRFAKINNRKK